MHRRQFLHQSTLTVFAIGLSFPHLAFSSSQNYKMGYQLFSIRDYMAKDPLNTLKALKAMGYEDFETYGYDAKTNRIYGYTVQKFKAVLDELGLTTTSGHYGFADYMQASNTELKAYVAQCIQAAKTLNSKYITWPFVPEDYRNPKGFEHLAKMLNLIGEQVTAAGLGFAYHNHGYEFESWYGTTGHQIIIENTNPDWVKLQMDMYWAVRSGKSPKELVAAHPGRYVMWHIKDMDPDTQDYTEMGKGAIDYPSLLPDPKTSGLEFYYVEQGGNYTTNSMESAATSAAYVKSNLMQLL